MLSDEYRVAFAGKRLGSIYMVEAEQVVLLRNIVEYVIWVMVLAFVMHGKKGVGSLRGVFRGLPSSRYDGFA